MKDSSNFISTAQNNRLKEGRVGWEAPSNIALVKYWGKKGIQIPKNPSISFTLNKSKTKTFLEFSPKKSTGFSFDVFLDGNHMPSFNAKIEAFFKRIDTFIPFLTDYHFTINTSNTFPHSSGIASSASGMSALALCLMAIEKMHDPNMCESFFKRKASFLSRLGSGSACRSIEGDIIVWGKHKQIQDSSDLYGIKYPLDVHDIFNDYQDTILLVDVGEKKVSSTAGHNLMHKHPFAKKRFKQAHQSIRELIPALKSGNLEYFIQIIELEALTLHAMMMTSTPYFILMKPNTLEIIHRIWEFRQATAIPICFTLDAGANVHLLYPKSFKAQCMAFIDEDLLVFTKNNSRIEDALGFGAKPI